MGSLRSLNTKKKPLLVEDEDGEQVLSLTRLKQAHGIPLGLGKSGEPILFPAPLQTRICKVHSTQPDGTSLVSYLPEIVLGVAETLTVGDEEYKTSDEAAIKALEASIEFLRIALESAKIDLDILRNQA